MVERQWKKFGKVKISTNPNGLFLFSFENEQACKEVSEQLWHVNNNPQRLKQWEPGMPLERYRSSSFPVWLKLRDVPYELWSLRGISLMGSKIGKPIQIDPLTDDRERMGFAKLYVDVDMTKSLPEVLVMKLRNGQKVRIIVGYLGLPETCNSCKVIGHSERECLFITLDKTYFPLASRPQVPRDGHPVPRERTRSRGRSRYRRLVQQKIWRPKVQQPLIQVKVNEASRKETALPDNLEMCKEANSLLKHQQPPLAVENEWQVIRSKIKKKKVFL